MASRGATKILEQAEVQCVSDDRQAVWQSRNKPVGVWLPTRVGSGDQRHMPRGEPRQDVCDAGISKQQSDSYARGDGTRIFVEVDRLQEGRLRMPVGPTVIEAERKRMASREKDRQRNVKNRVEGRKGRQKFEAHHRQQ